MRAVLAAGNVPAEGCRATAYNGTHDLQLGGAHVAAIGVTPNGTVVAENVRDLQSGTHRERWAAMPEASPAASPAGLAAQAGS
jgi:hypothetical protein